MYYNHDTWFTRKYVYHDSKGIWFHSPHILLFAKSSTRSVSNQFVCLQIFAVHFYKYPFYSLFYAHYKLLNTRTYSCILHLHIHDVPINMGIQWRRKLQYTNRVNLSVLTFILQRHYRHIFTAIYRFHKINSSRHNNNMDFEIRYYNANS